MKRVSIAERPDWQHTAAKYGFTFHHSGGQRYWDESAYYCFTLEQIERDIEQASLELHAMCLDLVRDVVRLEQLLAQLAIPKEQWDLVATSWAQQAPSLYGRFDLSYDGTGPAKLLEYNADTPTSLYETGFFQWQWLEEQIATQRLPAQADQFNSLHEALIARFANLFTSSSLLHFSSNATFVEDRQTVLYLEDLAAQAGLETAFVAIDDIGLDVHQRYVDTQGYPISAMFKLYPWEDMFREPYARFLRISQTVFLEPAWKAILSNKAMLPLLWQRHKGHPNLLPAAFEADIKACADVGENFVSKPFFSREGWDIDLVVDGDKQAGLDGGYGAEGRIIQAYHPLARFSGNYAVLGAWIVGDNPVALSIREDDGPITRDLARFIPHIILG
jgi:glutathionylspermidine synthase